jgi:hypothetical protein
LWSLLNCPSKIVLLGTSTLAIGGPVIQTRARTGFMQLVVITHTVGGGVRVTKMNGQCVYDLDFEYEFRDRYNWDVGKSVPLGPITISDKFMLEWHLRGLAKHFNMFGEVKQHVHWVRGQIPKDGDLPVPPPNRSGR